MLKLSQLSEQNENRPENIPDRMCGTFLNLHEGSPRTWQTEADDDPDARLGMHCREQPSEEEPQELFAGRFQLRKLLHQGGQGSVFHAWDEQLLRNVAVKVSHTSCSDDAIRFSRSLREGTLLAQINHPHLPQVYECGVHQGRPYLILEYVRGVHLREFIRKRSVTPRQIEHFMEDISAAVEAAHQASVLHLDLKPDNVIVTPSGHCKLVDFGLGWMKTSAEFRKLPVAAGTPGFMAPEQLTGQCEDWSEATDVFGLGGILYFMLYGTSPLPEEINRPEEVQTALQQLCLKLNSPTKLSSLSRLCAAALSADPLLRCPNVRSFRRLLKYRRNGIDRSLAVLFVLIGIVLLCLGLLLPERVSIDVRDQKPETGQMAGPLELKEIELALEVASTSAEPPVVVLWSRSLGFREINGLRRTVREGNPVWQLRSPSGTLVTNLEDDLVCVVAASGTASTGRRFSDPLLGSPFLDLSPELTGKLAGERFLYRRWEETKTVSSVSGARNRSSENRWQQLVEERLTTFGDQAVCLVSFRPADSGNRWEIPVNLSLEPGPSGWQKLPCSSFSSFK